MRGPGRCLLVLEHREEVQRWPELVTIITGNGRRLEACSEGTMAGNTSARCCWIEPLRGASRSSSVPSQAILSKMPVSNAITGQYTTIGRPKTCLAVWRMSRKAPLSGSGPTTVNDPTSH